MRGHTEIENTENIERNWLLHRNYNLYVAVLTILIMFVPYISALYVSDLYIRIFWLFKAHCMLVCGWHYSVETPSVAMVQAVFCIDSRQEDIRYLINLFCRTMVDTGERWTEIWTGIRYRCFFPGTEFKRNAWPFVWTYIVWVCRYFSNVGNLS
jgi:hypothetical protein